MNWIEFAIARHVAILRDLAAERPLTDDEQRLLEICEDETCRFLNRESLPGQSHRRPRWNARTASHAPLEKSRYRD
jgi:hypothetical protein